MAAVAQRMLSFGLDSRLSHKACWLAGRAPAPGGGAAAGLPAHRRGHRRSAFFCFSLFLFFRARGDGVETWSEGGCWAFLLKGVLSQEGARLASSFVVDQLVVSRFGFEYTPIFAAQ